MIEVCGLAEDEVDGRVLVVPDDEPDQIGRDEDEDADPNPQPRLPVALELPLARLHGPSLGGGGAKRSVAGNETRLAWGFQRTCLCEAERGTGGVSREGAQARAAKIAITAR